MDEEMNLGQQPDEADDLSTRVVLTDQDGNDTEFELLDIVECDGKQYVVLIPVDSIEDGEVVIFRIEGEGENESYVGVDTEEEAAKVFEVFKEATKDRYNFAEE
jgi:uncharacterized protein YrzB (UPF0473 family)